jgi:hypothetical protein
MIFIVLALAFGAAILFGAYRPEVNAPSGEVSARAPPTAAQLFCGGPTPILASPSMKRRAPATVFADIDAMETEFYRTGIKTISLKKAAEARQQLQMMHGEPECGGAAMRLPIVERIVQAAVVVEMDAAHAAQVAKDESGRAAFAGELEKKFLSGGQDFVIQAIGEKATNLRIKWVLIGRPFVYKTVNETDFLQSMRRRGFKKVTFTDGYDGVWVYDLN